MAAPQLPEIKRTLLQMKHDVQQQEIYSKQLRISIIKDNITQKNAAIEKYKQFAKLWTDKIAELEQQNRIVLDRKFTRPHESHGPRPLENTLISSKEDDIEDSPFYKTTYNVHRDESVFMDSEFDDLEDDIESKPYSDNSSPASVMHEATEKIEKEDEVMSEAGRKNESGELSPEIKDNAEYTLGDGVSFGDFW